MKKIWTKIVLMTITALVPMTAVILGPARGMSDKSVETAGKTEGQTGPAYSSTALQKEEDLFPQTDYQWLTHYMHQVYERYVQARRAFDNGETELARANLCLMETYAEKSKKKLPDSLQNGKDFDKKDYIETISTMKKYSAKIRDNLREGVWNEAPPGKLDPVLQTCVGCHSAYDIPTTFKLGTTFNKMVHIIHEIYELYDLAGQLADDCEKPPGEKCRKYVRACYMAVMPYINAVPSHIPEKNQDGERVDPAIFKQAYEKLRRYNRKALRSLEDGSSQISRLSAPPPALTRTCNACHGDNLRIEGPWQKKSDGKNK